MSVGKIADALVDEAVGVVKSDAVNGVEAALKGASSIPGRTGHIAGKLGDVIDDVQELVTDIGDVVKEVVGIFTGDEPPADTPKTE